MGGARHPACRSTEARDALGPLGLGDAKIQVHRRRHAPGAGRIEGERQGAPRSTKVTDALAKLGKVATTEVSVNDVGPSWGDEITSKARRALDRLPRRHRALHLAALRVEDGAGDADSPLVHDILVTVGVYSLSGFEVTPATVIAFLTILGYSLYDTIVVFDKVEENTKRPGGDRPHDATPTW